MAMSTSPATSPTSFAAEDGSNTYLRHVSIRVPWHDAEWDGTVCRSPLDNSTCLVLQQIAKDRNDDVEEQLAGKRWGDLLPEQRPPCHAERGGFMAPFGYTHSHAHRYATPNNKKSHGHFRPTTLRYPAYSALTIP